MDSVGKSLAVPQSRSRGALATLGGPAGAKPYLTRLSGWGANTRADCDLRVPELESQIRASLDPRGTAPRGLGRSYGDAAINSDGRVLGMTSFNRYLGFDDASGTLTCEAGVSLSDILRDFAPRGYVRQLLKDLEMVNAWAAGLDAQRPMLSQALFLYRELAKRGDSELDTSAIRKLYD